MESSCRFLYRDMRYIVINFGKRGRGFGTGWWVEAGRIMRYTVEKCLNLCRLLAERWIKGTSGESSEGKKDYIMGNRRKDSPCYIVGENLTQVCCALVWKSEVCKQETGMFSWGDFQAKLSWYSLLTEKGSGQTEIKGKKNLSSKMEPAHNDLGNSHCIQIEKWDKIRRITHRIACFGKEASGVGCTTFYDGWRDDIRYRDQEIWHFWTDSI